MVGPGALKPTVGDGIESRRPLHHQFLFSLFFLFHICICIGVYIIIIGCARVYTRIYVRSPQTEGVVFEFCACACLRGIIYV